MLQHPQWECIILSELNDMLYKGAIHSSVGKGLTVLLPKITEPTQWGDYHAFWHNSYSAEGEPNYNRGEATVVANGTSRGGTAGNTPESGENGKRLGGRNLDREA